MIRNLVIEHRKHGYYMLCQSKLPNVAIMGTRKLHVMINWPNFLCKQMCFDDMPQGQQILDSRLLVLMKTHLVG